MRRREFIAGAAALTGCLLSPALQPSAMRCRRSLLDLPPDAPDLFLYKQAVSRLTKMPAPDGTKSYWIYLAEIHHGFCQHYNWWFLPWHRAYIYYFEQVCRQVLQRTDFTLPYWDWLRHPAIPDPFLESGSPLSGPRYGAATQLRSFPDDTALKIITEPVVGNLWGGITAYPSREKLSAGSIDTPHISAHQNCGGLMLGDMSPQDPLFWVLHSNVDRLWESWLSLHGWVGPSDPDWGKQLLGDFYDPQSKTTTAARVPCSQTLISAQFGAKYDRLETLEGAISPVARPNGALDMILSSLTPPASQSLPVLQVFFGPGEQITAQGMTPVVVSASGETATINGAKTTLTLPASPQMQALLEKLPPSSSPAFTPSFILLVDQVPIATSPTSVMQVFLGAPGSVTPTLTDDPGYVGTVSLFPFPIPDPSMEHKQTSFTFNISQTIARLKAAGRLTGNLDVTLQAVDLQNPNTPPDAARPAKVRIAGLN